MPKIVEISWAPMIFSDCSRRSKIKSSPVIPKTLIPSSPVIVLSEESANFRNYSPALRNIKTYIDVLCLLYNRKNSVPANSGDVATEIRQLRKLVRSLSSFSK